MRYTRSGEADFPRARRRGLRRDEELPLAAAGKPSHGVHLASCCSNSPGDEELPSDGHRDGGHVAGTAEPCDEELPAISCPDRDEQLPRTDRHRSEQEQHLALSVRRDEELSERETDHGALACHVMKNSHGRSAVAVATSSVG